MFFSFSRRLFSLELDLQSPIVLPHRISIDEIEYSHYTCLQIQKMDKYLHLVYASDILSNLGVFVELTNKIYVLIIDEKAIGHR
jgi:hypothetical protein